VATDAASLLSQANVAGYQGYSASGYMLDLIKLALLQQILLASNPMAATDAKTLLAQANCYQCFAGNDFALRLIELALLQQIVGGVTTICIIGGVGPPTVPVPCNFSMYVQQPPVPRPGGQSVNFGFWLGDMSSGWFNMIPFGP